jgi:putative phosphoribosyl transferase
MNSSMVREHITLSVAGVHLKGDLALPAQSYALVVFAHGSGCNPKSQRSRDIARALERAGFGTLLLDLLTADEETAEHEAMARSFEVEALASRLADSTDWLGAQATTRSLSIGYFGAGTGAAVALTAAAGRPMAVRAVVCQAGRTDLAAGAIPRVEAPTLLIADSDDPTGLELNREAMTTLRCERGLSRVAGASHLLAEPGSIERVAALAAEWFEHHLPRQGVGVKTWGPGGPAHCESFRPSHRGHGP